MNKFDQLSQLIANFNHNYANFAQKKGLNFNELHFLYYLLTHQNVSPNDISKKWSIPKQTINSVCNKFIKKGFIVSNSSSTDKRKKILTLTSKGKEFFFPIAEEINCVEMQTQEQLTQKKLSNFLAEFEHINSLFEKTLSEK